MVEKLSESPEKEMLNLLAGNKLDRLLQSKESPAHNGYLQSCWQCLEEEETVSYAIFDFEALSENLAGKITQKKVFLKITWWRDGKHNRAV